MKIRILLLLPSLLCLPWLALAEKPGPDAFFDGNSLTGWHADPEDTLSDWSVKNGVIVGDNPDKKGSVLWTDSDHGDYELSLEFQTDSPDYDSGIFLRGKSHQVQIGVSRSLKRDLTACIYAPKDKQGKYPAESDKIAAVHKLGEWNKLRIVVTGKRIQTFLNGESFVDYQGITIPETGPIGLQLHAGVHQKMRFRNLAFTPATAASPSSTAAPARSSSRQNPSSPNIIIYMVDDLGWNHISADQVTMGTHRDEYRTPHLEKLATEGLSFTHAYAQPNCAPTRAAMLSGQYPTRIHNDVYVVQSLNRYGRGGISKENSRFTGPSQSEDVAPEAVTIAEALKKNGYATAHIGKYHVGGHKDDNTMPENVGFDINIGGFSQGHQPTCFASKQNGDWQFKKVGLGHFDQYAEPYSKEYIKKHGLPAELVDSPKHISDAVGDALEDTIDTLAADDKPFYLQFHTYAVHGPVKSRPDLEEAAKKYGASKANYSGFIASVDENLRRMREALDDPNHDGDTSDSIADNTIILFTSDNGGTHADNLPLKGNKGMLTEGGVRVPLIACWPGVIPPGTVTDRKIHAVDYYPTCLDLAGNKWSPPAADHPLDGESFAAVLRNPDKKDKREPVFYLFPGYLDARAQPTVVVIDDLQGKRYKLYYFYESDAWELYCLTDDQPEAKNIFKTNPEIAATLSKKINQWLTQEHPTWKPKYPIAKDSGQPAGPPPTL